MELQTHILNHLIHNEEFCRRVVPYLRKDYFEGSNKIVFDLIVKFVAKHNKIPTDKILELEQVPEINRSCEKCMYLLGGNSLIN